MLPVVPFLFYRFISQVLLELCAAQKNDRFEIHPFYGCETHPLTSTCTFFSSFYLFAFLFISGRSFQFVLTVFIAIYFNFLADTWDRQSEEIFENYTKLSLFFVSFVSFRTTYLPKLSPDHSLSLDFSA